MTRQRDGKATRQAIFDDHGGELRFWLGWVHGEIDGAVQERLRGQARRDPALQQDVDSLDVPAARRDLRHALEATSYLTPKGAAPPPAEDADDVTNLVLQDRTAARLPAPVWLSLTPMAHFAARRLAPDGGAACAPPGETAALDQPRRALRQALDQLNGDERARLLAEWHSRDSCKQSLLRVLLPDDDQPPVPRTLPEEARLVRRAEARLRQALGAQRERLRSLGPDRLWDLLGEEHLAAAWNGRLAAPVPPPQPGTAARKARRPSGGTEVYRRIGRSLFRLLEEVEIPLPPRDEPGEATRLLQHLVGRDALAHFRDLTGWLLDTRARIDRAGDPSFCTARDRLLLWLAPECFLTDGRRPRFELSFRLYLRARLKDYCRQRGWRPAGSKYGDLECAFRGLDRQRIGDIVREAAEEAARAKEEAPALVGLPLAQALQWLQVAP